MVYIDIKDFNIYQSVSDTRIQSSFFEVDEFIAPVISLLNKKGYITSFCCSGHLVDEYHNDNTTIDGLNGTFEVSFCTPRDLCYIIFVDKNQFKNTTDFPKNILVEYDDYNEQQRVKLEFKYSETNNIKERFVEIFNTMLILYEWAEELPSLI